MLLNKNTSHTQGYATHLPQQNMGIIWEFPEKVNANH